MRWVLIFSLLGLGCIPETVKRPPREKWAEFAIENLWRQRSFTYHHEINHNRPPVIEGYEDGVYIPGYGWQAEGEWDYGGEKGRFEIVAIGKEKYERMGEEWHRSILDKEETIEARIKKVVSFGKFRLEGEKYRFKPNLFYLDPMGKEKFSGWLEVDPDRLLPKRISVVGEDGVVVWMVEFKGFNRKRWLSPPIHISRRFRLSPATPDLVGRLRKRLKCFGLKFRIEYRLGEIDLRVESPITAERLRSLLRPGRLELIRGHWEHDRFMKDSLLGGKELIHDGRIGFDPLSRPRIELGLSRTITIKGHIGLFLDDELLATKYFDNEVDLNKIQFLMLSDFQKAEMAVGVATTPDLPEFRIEEVGDK